ncbi:MAG: M48 family metalloprotease [Hyphomicrobiales bacterium]
MTADRLRNGTAKFRQRAMLAATVLLAVTLAGCKLSNDERIYVDPIRPAAATRANSADAAIGEREHPKIVTTYGGIYENRALEKRLGPVVARLVSASDDPSQPYRVTILNSPTVNAFALPGGYLYVTRGLLALAGDTSEVAAVLAHEIAHVTMRHAIEREDRAKAAAVASQVVADVLNDEAKARATLAASELELASFSRSQELQADAIGVRTIARAGFDPYAAARFLKAMDRFADLAKAGTDKNPDFLSSHPSTPERVQRAVEQARQHGPAGSGLVDRDGYLDALDGMLFGDDPGEGYVRGQSFVHPGLGITFTASSDYSLQNTAKAVLGTAADDTALRFDSIDVPGGQPLATYLGSGWMNGLEAESVSPATINGMEAATAIARSDGWNFRVAVIRDGTQTYRFIFAARQLTATVDSKALATINSFRRLTPTEAARIRPLRIRAVTVAAGDTAEKLSARMATANRYATFLVLNGLEPGTDPAPGTKVKIVTY